MAERHLWHVRRVGLRFVVALCVYHGWDGIGFNYARKSPAGPPRKFWRRAAAQRLVDVLNEGLPR